MSGPTLPDRIISLMRANQELKEEVDALRESDHDAWINFYMAAEEQLEAVVSAMRCAHGSLIRLHQMAINVKKKQEIP